MKGVLCGICGTIWMRCSKLLFFCCLNVKVLSPNRKIIDSYSEKKININKKFTYGSILTIFLNCLKSECENVTNLFEIYQGLLWMFLFVAFFWNYCAQLTFDSYIFHVYCFKFSKVYPCKSFKEILWEAYMANFF